MALQPAQTPEPRPDERRVDARRNYEQLVEGAIRVLAEDPGASLQEIAAAAGLHRATLHRHFRSREDLMEVLRRRAAQRMLGNLEAVTSGDLAPAEALAALSRRALDGAIPDGLWRLGTYYGPGSDEHRDEIQEKLSALLAAAQAAGAARRDLTPTVLGAVWTGVVYGMLPLLHVDDIDVDGAIAVILSTVRGVDVVAAPGLA